MIVDVLLPLHVEQLFSYAVPDSVASRINAGCRVVVLLGKTKSYTGIVIRVRERDTCDGIKSITDVLDEERLFVSPTQLALWEWMSSYYMCFAGDVLRAALPAGLQWSDPRPFSPLTERYVRIASPQYEGKLTDKQAQLFATMANLPATGIARKELVGMPGITEAILSALLKKRVLEMYSHILLPRIKFISSQNRSLCHLTDYQLEAYTTLSKAVLTPVPALLKGISGTGKTEICARLIQDTLQCGKQALYLLPDLKDTSFAIERLACYFGSRMVAYHSKITQRERLNLWSYLSQENKEPLLVVGTRSALFLPFSELGLVIVNDEHDDSYKQNDPAPRYHARNVALMLAKLHGAGIVLSSATPSIESYHHAMSGKYVLAELSQRYGNAPLPTIHVENSAELKRKKIQKGIFSPLLLEKMEKAFASGEQVLLYQNRKHYARASECSECGWTPQCSRCQVVLAYSLHRASLLCPYCGQPLPLPKACPQCRKTVTLKGIGAERVEEELLQLFPSVRAARIDGDTIENEQHFVSVIKAFNAGELDLLIGTRLLIGNINFSRIRVVGVINGDLLLNAPDFRAHEKAFQTFIQLAGYAGCDGKESDVIVQTGQAQLPLMETLLNYDYSQMYRLQCDERKQYAYPPFTRLIRIFVTGDEAYLPLACQLYSELLYAKLGNRVSGPVPVEKPGRTQPACFFLLKIESSASFLSVRATLKAAQTEAIQKIENFKKLHIAYDIDPVS